MTVNRWQTAEDYLREVDSVFGALIDSYGPCRLIKASNFFDTLCESIICQQISTKAAESIMKRFRALFLDGQVMADTLLQLDLDILRGAGLSPQKIKYVRDLAEKVLIKEVDLAHIESLSNVEIEAQLLQVKGIGPWTVTMFLLFALNRTDILPVGDLGIKKAIQNLYHLSDLPTPEMIRQIAKPWHPFESIAAWYLWRSLENKSS